MNRFSRRDTSLRIGNNNGDDDDEEKLYEKQALIDDDELCSDENDDINRLSTLIQFGIRQRQSPSKSKSISNSLTYNIGAGANFKNETHELRAISGDNRPVKDFISEQVIDYTNYDIQPGDSLQNICLRYACSVNQVKRLNGLMTDQEFYALRRIKLPLGKLGLLGDLLKSQQQSNSKNDNDSPNLLLDNQEARSSSDQLSRPRMVNSPGSALSVSNRRNPQFKPLLSPGFSSDRINELNKLSSASSQNHDRQDDPNYSSSRLQHNHSNSFSSLREFDGTDVEINISPYNHHHQRYNRFNLDSTRQQTLIKSNLDHVDVDDLLMMERSDNVGKVFEDLDYHVEKAKAAAETYDQRVADLVDSIDIDGISSQNIHLNSRHVRVSKIPELFFCNENFGLSFKKLLVLIFIVCLVFPLVYINSLNANVSKQH